MKNLEFNKYVAAILVAGLVAMIAGNLADILYKPNLNFKAGYKVAIADNPIMDSSSAVQADETIDVVALLAKASAENGAVIVKKCVICHDFSKGGPNKVGPNLWSIVGNKKAHRDDFNYSKALMEKGGLWVYDDLFHMLHKPAKFIPGTKMNFIGLKNYSDVADVIMYLRTLSDNPIPLPTAEVKK